MKPKRPIGFEAPTTLPDPVAAILLAGWDAKPPQSCSAEQHEAAYWFVMANGEGKLWADHEAYLRTIAARWKWAPQAEWSVSRDRPLYFAEGFYAEFGRLRS